MQIQLLRGSTFTVPIKATDPGTVGILQAFPQAAQRKIPMYGQFRADVSAWEIDVHRFWERPMTWWTVGGLTFGLLAGIFIGRAGAKK